MAKREAYGLLSLTPEEEQFVIYYHHFWILDP